MTLGTSIFFIATFIGRLHLFWSISCFSRAFSNQPLLHIALLEVEPCAQQTSTLSYCDVLVKNGIAGGLLCLRHQTGQRRAASHSCIPLQCLLYKNNYRARGIHQFFIYFDFSSGYISVVNFKRILRGIQTLKLALSEGLFADTFVFKGVFSGFSAWNTRKMCVIRNPEINQKKAYNSKIA